MSDHVLPNTTYVYERESQHSVDRSRLPQLLGESRNPESNLVGHAERELMLAALLPSDLQSEIDPMNTIVGQCILDMVVRFSEAGHSGTSAEYTRALLNALLAFEPITPNNHEHYTVHEGMGPTGDAILQDLRDSRYVSIDNGKTWENVDSPRGISVGFRLGEEEGEEPGYLIDTGELS